jgi:hypothetical protein
VIREQLPRHDRGAQHGTPAPIAGISSTTRSRRSYGATGSTAPASSQATADQPDWFGWERLTASSRWLRRSVHGTDRDGGRIAQSTLQHHDDRPLCQGRRGHRGLVVSARPCPPGTSRTSTRSVAGTGTGPAWDANWQRPGPPRVEAGPSAPNRMLMEVSCGRSPLPGSPSGTAVLGAPSLDKTCCAALGFGAGPVAGVDRSDQLGSARIGLGLLALALLCTPLSGASVDAKLAPRADLVAVAALAVEVTRGLLDPAAAADFEGGGRGVSLDNPSRRKDR